MFQYMHQALNLLTYFAIVDACMHKGKKLNDR